MTERQETHILHLRMPGISPAGTSRKGAAAVTRDAVTRDSAARGSGAARSDDRRGRAAQERDGNPPGGNDCRHDGGSLISRGFTAFSNKVAHLAGRPVSFVLCCVTIIVWAVSGPIFHYSDTWQLIINTSTTIVTFLMVFLIQNTQNRDGAAVQAKLDELIRALEGARNHFIGIEHLTEEQLEAIRSVCEREAMAQGAEAGGSAAIEIGHETLGREPASRK
jgi:low affinity Fe/Cu permease